jgi:TonB family protein
MISPVLPFWRMAPAGFLLPAFLLSVPNVLAAAKAAPRPQLQELDTKTAARLVIHIDRPEYPPVAKVNLIQGNVRLEVKVTSKGKVFEAHVIDGEPILAAAALQSVWKWLYRPYLSNGKPEPFSSYVLVKFNLWPHTLKEQLPDHANDDLEKQVHPPEVISRPRMNPSAAGIRMKILVGSNGDVVDATSSKTEGPEIEMARKNLRSWKFRPARWGAIAVPWYVTVTVPLSYSPLDQVANSAKH